MRKSARLLPNIGAGRPRRCTSSCQAASAPGVTGSTVLRVNATSSSSHSRASAAPRSVNKTWSPPPSWRRCQAGERIITAMLARSGRYLESIGPYQARLQPWVEGQAFMDLSGGPDDAAQRQLGELVAEIHSYHAAAVAHARAVCGRRVARLAAAAGRAGSTAVILECGAARAIGSGSRIAASHGALDRRVSGD